MASFVYQQMWLHTLHSVMSSLMLRAVTFIFNFARIFFSHLTLARRLIIQSVIMAEAGKWENNQQKPVLINSPPYLESDVVSCPL